MHVAAANDAVHVAGLLIERGAEIDPYERNYSNTPLDVAVYYDHARMIDVLRLQSRDVWNLTPIGDIERLREIIAADPQLAVGDRCVGRAGAGGLADGAQPDPCPLPRNL